MNNVHALLLNNYFWDDGSKAIDLWKLVCLVALVGLHLYNWPLMKISQSWNVGQ